MEIKRDRYLNRLISLMWNGQIKVITGIRRCGKSYLMRKLFRDHLIAQGVEAEQIITIELDLIRDIKYRNPILLADYIRSRTADTNKKYYLFIDEIQLSDEVENPYSKTGKKITFYDALNEFRNTDNLDVYVTGSNSKMLSSDILTEFRGRSDEVRVHPLSFSEFYSFVGGDKHEAFEEYAFYGGLPFVLSRPDDTSKMEYLSSLFNEVYLKDIIERKNVEREDVLDEVLNLLCSSVGSLTNPNRIANTLKSKQQTNVSVNTIKTYIDHLKDAFLFSESKRYDVKGKHYFDYPNKYYCEDVGLRNARIEFRQQEITHIMENIIYNELFMRGYSIDVGVVFSREKQANGSLGKIPREIDFIAVKGGRRVYIQSAYAMPDKEKTDLESRPFKLVNDTFPKIIVRHDINKRWYDDSGILNIGVIDFLLDDSVI